ncbi:hypothetical protein AB0M36_17940 [Actinoplanes sp. NPDC051346]|uniref:hypothetical protein n=1 Tax=Actinoplanes sp. NPDC051346 TaxID=3155048 RepID=UPI003413066F
MSALTLTVLATLTGCAFSTDESAAKSATPSSSPSASAAPTTTLPADYVGVSEPSPANSTAPVGIASGTGYLQGAGWALLPRGVEVGGVIRTYQQVFDAKTGAQTVGNYLIGHVDMRAAPGRELVVADLSGTLTPTSHVAGQNRPGRVTVHIGGAVHRVKLDKDLRLVLSVPIGAPVRLTVEDAEPQSLDLRTGGRVATRADHQLFYAPLSQKQLDGPLCGFAGTTVVSSTVRATLVPGATAGYAPPGRAFVVASLTLTSVERMSLALDPSSIRLTAGGKTVDARPPLQTSLTNIGDAGVLMFQGELRAVFEVPDTVRSATLNIAMTGRATTDDGVKHATRTPRCGDNQTLKLQLKP